MNTDEHRRFSRRLPRWMRPAFYLCLSVFICGFLNGCSVGPDYVRPSAPFAPEYKELEGWKPAQPQDDVLRGAWWELYGDPDLNELEAQVDVANQNLATAEAQFRQARTLVWSARAAYYPTAGLGVSFTRSHQSGNLFGNLGGSGNNRHQYALPVHHLLGTGPLGPCPPPVQADTAHAHA